MLRVLRRLLAVFAVVCLAVAAGTIVPRPLWPPEGGWDTRSILVLSNPIHTDVAIPLDADIRERFAFLKEAGIPILHPEAHWVTFGWGSRAFYLETPAWSELKPGPVLKALTLDRSVLHVDVAGNIPQPNPAVAAFPVDEDGFERLIAFIEGSFERSGDKPVLIPDAAYGATDRFFEAKGQFNALLGCNTWTARGLRAAGLRTGWWNPMPATLSMSLALYN
jgi:uncharacterized protein (TIGR02117 family)